MNIDKLYLRLLVSNISNMDDEKSFEKLFKLFYNRLVSFSEHYTHSTELSEEIVSEVFVRIWNNRKQVGGVSNIESYLFVAVKNESLNNLGRVEFSSIKVSQQVQPEISDLIDTFDPEKELETRELMFNITIAIDSLPTQCRTVFKMVKEDGLRYKEVADILNISVRTVESQLVRALKRLDMALAPYIEKRIKKIDPKASPKEVTELRKRMFLFLF